MSILVKLASIRFILLILRRTILLNFYKKWD